MNFSQSSSMEVDPLSSVLDTLGGGVTRQTRLEAAGSWALAFPPLDRLKFVALLRGAAWLRFPGQPPRQMVAGDVCLIGRTAYSVASDPDTPPIDGGPFYDAGVDVAQLGGDETIGIGGTVTFATDNADFLLDMLPEMLFVPASSPTSDTVRSVLALLGREAARDALGTSIVSARLADVLLVEAIRAYATDAANTGLGWLGAVSDPRLGRALRALHGDIARPWTVAELAQQAAMSRAAFSAAFADRVGQPPLSYLRHWRLTAARAALARGEDSIATVARRVGYTSQSAFGHAYRAAFGAPPSQAGQPD